MSELNGAWPLANIQEREGGWTLSVNFLKAIMIAANAHDQDVTLENTEAVLLAVQAHALLSSNI